MDKCNNCFSCQVDYGGANNCNSCKSADAPQKLNHMAIWNTNRCNLRCKYCFVFERSATQPHIDISDAAIDVLPSFYEKYYDITKTNMIYFFGGEPLAAFDKLQKVYSRLKCYPINWSITSNLTLMDEEKAAWLGERGFHVLCSIDGIREADTSRVTAGGGESFDMAIAGLRMVRKHIQANPEIRTTITPQNVKYAFDSFIFFAEQGLTFQAAEPVYEVAWSKEDIALLMEQHVKVAEFITHHRNYGLLYKPMTDVKNAIFNRNQPQMSWTKRCGAAQTGIAVDTDGSLYSCHRFVSDHRPSLRIGNVFDGIDESARTALQLKLVGKRPQNVTDTDKCKHCLIQRVCSGGCIACNYDMNEHAYLVPDSYCDIQSAQVKALASYVLDLDNTLVVTENQKVR
jgi:uncharacterized protein